MPRRRHALLLNIVLERAGAVSLQQQIYQSIRAAILARQLRPRTLLPSSRTLATDLGVGRNTVIAAYERLIVEGLIQALPGAGMRVVDIQALGIAAIQRNTPQRPVPLAALPLSQQARRAMVPPDRPFSGISPGEPDLAHFPFALWAKLLGQTWRDPRESLASQRDPAGYRPLRDALARHLATYRGVQAHEDQVILVSGIRQAIDLSSRLLLEPGDKVWMEDPGYPGTRAALMAAGALPQAIPVDEAGIDPIKGQEQAPEARLAIVTPSHQYPLGSVLSLPRRMALLDWAARNGSLIIEDDYDSEFRYDGPGLPALQGLDRQGCVLYVGSFSKVLFPALRLGYLILPESLVEPALRLRDALDGPPSAIAQAALARFIEEGHFAAHLRRMRRIYAARQRALIAALSKQAGRFLSVGSHAAGLHVVAFLKEQFAAHSDQDRHWADLAVQSGLTALPLSNFYAAKTVRQGLLIGYAPMSEAALDRAVRSLVKKLAKAI